MRDQENLLPVVIAEYEDLQGNLIFQTEDGRHIAEDDFNALVFQLIQKNKMKKRILSKGFISKVKSTKNDL